MNSRTLAILGIVTIVVAALAYWSMRGSSSTTETPAPAGAATRSTSAEFVPELVRRGNDVASITVKGGGKEAVVKKAGDAWVMENRGGYPVDFEKVRDAVQCAAELQVQETKTADPAKLDHLWLNDPSDDPESKSRLVTFVDSSNKVISSFVLGSSTPSSGSAPGSTPTYSVYVRRSGETQSYQARSRLDPRATLEPNTAMWLKREALNIEQSRVRSVSITHPDGTRVEVSKDKKDDRDYKLANIPAGRELKYGGAATPVASALSYVNFDDVAPLAQVAEGATPTGSAEYRTFDGLVISVDTSTKNDIAWANFTARYEAPPEPPPVPSDQPPPAAGKPEAEVKKEVQELNDRLSTWAFSLPSFKMKQILSTMEELLKPADQTPVKIDQGAPEKPPAPPPPQPSDAVVPPK